MIKTLCSGIVVYILCSLSCMAATNSTLYSDNFEIQYTNNTPLINTNSWYSSSWIDTNGATIVATVLSNANFAAPGSTNVATIPLDVTLSNRYAASTSTNVWLHMQTKIVRYDGPTNVVYDTNSTAMFYVDSNGYCVVRNGTSGWTTITKTLSGQDAVQINTNLFTTIDVYLNYSNKTWRLNAGSNSVPVPLTNNIGFINTNNSSLSNFDVYNSGFATSYLDNVAVYDFDMLPRLSLSPAGLTNTSIYTESATSQSFEVRSSGDGQLSYYIITNDLTWAGCVPWATITNAASGTLTDNATNTVWIRYVNTSNMVPGAYYNSFSVISTNLEGQSNNFLLTLNIQGMSVSTNSLASSKMLGYAAETQSFKVFQTGAGSADYRVTTNPAALWLSVSPGTNTLAAGETKTNYISYFTNDLTTAGISTTTLAIATLNGSVTQLITVAMTTYSRPAPKTSFTNYSQTIQKGQLPTNTNLGVWNSGAAPIPWMTYTVTSDVSWLTVDTSGTTTTNETNSITVSFASDTTNYSGLYTGHLTVRGTDAGPASSYSPTGYVIVSTQVTVSVLIIAPGKPGGLTATEGTSADNVQLTWNTTTNLDHFELWQGTNSSVSNATRFVASAGTATSYTDTGIMPGIIYYYWVRTVNAYGGAGEYSASDTGWRSLPGPTGLTASDGLYTNRVALSWTASYGAQTYEVWRSEINLTNTASLVGTVSSALSGYDDTSAIVETVYYYWIKSRTPYMGTFSASDTGYRAALMQPTGVLASDGEFTNKVRVIWQAVDKAESYEILRNTSSDRSGATKVGDSTASGYDDESAIQGIYFYYWIRASSSEGYSIYSDYDYGWRQLVAPSGIAASDGIYPYRIRVTWDASQNATSYEVWRGQGTGVGGKANTGALKLGETTSLYYNDHATIVNTPYYYKVRAMSALGGAATDYSSSDFGWREIAAATTTLPVKNDYDGDHLSDLTLYNSTSGVWQILCSVIGQYDLSFGDANRHGVQGDYDGDGISDPMIYRPDHGTWLVMLSSIGYSPIIAGYFGGGGADSAPADYDGDGITDLVVYNESDGVLSVCFSNGGAFNSSVSVSMGGTGWAIVSADYDGDHKADPAVYSESTGLLAAKLSSGGYADVNVPIGGSGITMHGADYDGDAKADLVTYEEATGNWIAKLSSAGYASVPITMGGAGYQPIPADYDGDGKTDPAVYSESTGNWMIRFSASGYPLIEDTYGGTNCLPVGR